MPLPRILFTVRVEGGEFFAVLEQYIFFLCFVSTCCCVFCLNVLFCQYAVSQSSVFYHMLLKKSECGFVTHVVSLHAVLHHMLFCQHALFLNMCFVSNMRFALTCVLFRVEHVFCFNMCLVCVKQVFSIGSNKGFAFHVGILCLVQELGRFSPTNGVQRK